jgi:hypothetical protein
MMKLRFSESEIVSWAGRYYYPHEESELIQLKQKIQNQGHLNKEQLRLVARWKAPRSAGHMEKNSPEYVREITSWSFSAIEERGKIESLTLLSGVHWPSASVILHLFHKDPYPILDFRALWSVSSDVPKQYSFDFWWKYTVFCRAIAKKNSLDMRTLDRALWQYSKENQKT